MIDVPARQLTRSLKLRARFYRRSIETPRSIAMHDDKRSVTEAIEELRALREANLALFRTLAPKQSKHFGRVPGPRFSPRS
jgi:hypothetical protein